MAREDNLDQMNIQDVIQLDREWILRKQLGAGGFARVFLAQAQDGQLGVVKLIPKAPGAQRELLFEDLNGVPNVVPVIETGEWGDHWVLVMPQAEVSLRDYLNDQGGQLAVDDAVSVLIDIAEALVGIEGRVVHRDIKPENILLMSGHWCLADFGIARYAEATTAPDTLKHAMTPPYAAPEQWRGETASSATDVYAVGVVAYELLNGQRPFKGPNYRNQHLEGSVEPMSGIPAKLRFLVEECLYKPAPTRPVPQNVLARLQANMQAASPAAARLQEANVVAVQRKAEEQRQQSVAQVAAERRRELREVANQSFKRTLALLDRQIMDNAPSVQSSATSLPRTWSLNNATLRVDGVVLGPNSNSGMPFEVVAHTVISVGVPKNRSGYAGRSHSLWYCDAMEPGVFRWYETAFHAMMAFGNDGFQPFALSPGGQDVVFALDNVMHTVQVARPFTPIDQGEEEEFAERWIDWFADAAQGQLRHPDRMPESQPRGSWRQRR